MRPGQQAATSAKLAAVTKRLDMCMAQNQMALDQMRSERVETVAKLAEVANALAAHRQRPLLD